MQNPISRTIRTLGAVLLLGAGLSAPLRAASTGTAVLMPQGNTAGTANGDYVTAATGGLNTFYRFFIEVPSGLGRLVVEVFDADVGRGAAADETGGRDRARNTNYNSSVTYTLLRPDGSTAATLACNATTCTDNAWNTVLNSTTAQNTAVGHWELRVTMGAGDDINAIGVQANDGTAGGGGTELNVYVDSIVPFGVHPPANGTTSRSYTLYPYLTSGCSASKNDFDYDSNNGTVGSESFTSRTGAFTQSYASAALSADNVWDRDSFSGWTSDQISGGYGIWTFNDTITSYVNGNGQNGNYTDVYLANFQAAANPPTANPPANSFRIYLPTDAVAAPVKPYIDQTLTFSGCGGGNNGPNPPAVGQTSCYTVTVRVVNPTAQPIVFSTPNNIVTANIPGGRVLYGGIATATAGTTIVTQPAVGGSGNITWNPGTVNGGVTVLLAYRVRVTPNAAGQRNPMTGTPALNGTRAQFVDETGNTTQARSTYLFGPLCELATTVAAITQAVVSDVHAFRGDAGGVRVEWRTASEAGTAGFYLHRWDRAARRWVRVSEALLAALQSAPQGGVYRFLDAGASPTEPQIYLLEEVEAGGRRRTHGPYALAVDWQRPERPEKDDDGPEPFDRAAHPATRRAPAAGKGLILSGGAAGMHLTVRRSGLYSLRSADIAAWLGLAQKSVESLIASGKLELTRGGRPVAWTPDPTIIVTRRPQGLLFFGEAGEAQDGVYSAGSVYRLRQGQGLLMESRDVAPKGAASAKTAGTFPELRHTETDAFPATVLGLDPDSDYWFWEFLQADDPTYGHHAFALDAPGVASGAAALSVKLEGATDSGVKGEHHVQVALNGTLLGETAWQGIAAHSATFELPEGLLLASGNQVEVTATAGGGAPYSIVYVDSFDLAYRRTLRAAGDALAFTADAETPGSVAGFTGSEVWLLDVADPLHPRWLIGATATADAADGGAWRLGFAAQPGVRYLAAAPSAVAAPAAVRPWSASSLRSAANRADYLVVAPTAFAAAAERLADLRRNRGLDALVVGLDEVFDEFNGGVPSPYAIRDLFAWARKSWSRAPRYAVLAGAGSLDYRNLLGYGDCLVPPLLVRSQGGLFPSDNALADGNGDGVPEMAVGRLPVLSAAGLDAYTAKIAAYEGGAAAAWARNVLFLSDTNDGGTVFAVDSDRVAAQAAGGYSVQSIALQSTPLAAARAQLLDGLTNGAALVNYMGHGGLDRLSAGGLLTSADAAALTNGERLPVLTAMTCTINRFAVPGFPSLGETLVNNAAGGAAAVWGPSGLADNAQSRLLAEVFYRSLGDPGDPLLGDRILHALGELRSLGGDASLATLYNLLGDPALRLRPMPEPPASGSASGE